MITVTRSRSVLAQAELWQIVSSVERLPEWLTFAEAAESIDGEALVS